MTKKVFCSQQIVMYIVTRTARGYTKGLKINRTCSITIDQYLFNSQHVVHIYCHIIWLNTKQIGQDISNKEDTRQAQVQFVLYFLLYTHTGRGNNLTKHGGGGGIGFTLKRD